MSERTDRILIQEILIATRNVETYFHTTTPEKFYEDTMRQDAIIRNLEVIGEAIKNLSALLKSNHSEIPFSDYARLRDRLIHQYFSVDLSILLDVITIDVPDLKMHLESLLKSFDK